MKTRRLSTILTSAYLSAMLASSVAPVRSDATLASTIDPQAARQAFQTAVNGLDGSGWATSEIPAAPVDEPIQVTYAARRTPSEPVMTAELMARLIKYAHELPSTGSVSSKLCKVLELCDGTANMPLKLAQSDSNDGQHYFAVPPDAASKDILILVKHDTIVEAYLTNRAGTLRAAAILENTTATLITNEKAAAKFKTEMSLFAGEAASLPPTGGTSVASTEVGG